ncbi:4-alpha-glucanotransferase [Gaiella occulta]|uniref:4-alpha-glucanotransferase n=1 Tax=Gaiella occulta TaxID=1002870 RepID=A0A7M2YZW3_9ACTN|nr:4-alpha-glucanotransferase [Gaiella occulta]RDI75676.1 4-alpha-glucanotransferase [Gaiella occulta]
MWLTRSLGVALHPTSLPGGRLGPEAYAFVDWLAAAGVRWWQVLPLNPPDEFGSPYASTSAFACWPGLLADPGAAVAPSDLRAFERRHAYWIGDWVDYAGGDALAGQVRVEREWSALRAYAAQRGVRIVGDVPIYVARGGCDHTAHPELFLPGDVVAGAPPDPLNGEGQKWGNPLYDWEALAREGYRWWTERMRRVLGLVDVFRIDHFRGFAGYWTVPASAETAREGHWTPGPGAAVFRAAEAELGPLPVIAEDLGLITPDVQALRDELGFPGMVVLLWAFGGPADNPHRLEHHRVNQVVYTSTHDTDTLAGHFPGQEPWPLLELALSSRCALAVVPAQDVLELGSEARMNRPGEVGGNWSWRLEPGRLGPGEAARLRRAGEAAARV